ncbi:MAG: alkaline phosphatase family protein [Acidobacteria bacterium]|nr:alkaline phosphatase family protein [Acidobacteriota bacterium]
MMPNNLANAKKKFPPTGILSALLIALLMFSPGLRAQSQATAPTASNAKATDAYLIMISIDGLLPEYYTAPAALGLKVPNLTAMKLGGAYAEGVEGIYPSITYPAHTTLITGVRPATHGIVQNRIFEAPNAPQTGEWYWFAEAIKTPTLYGLAKKAGLKTAGVGWPVTVKAELDYNVPEIFDPAEKPPTGKRTMQYATPGLLQKALAANPTTDTTTDGRRTAISEFIIKEYQPRLLLIHLVDLDSAQHTYGPRTAQALAVVERQDAYLGRLIAATRQAGIFEKTTFMLVSDHGFAPVDKKYAPNVTLAKEKLITLDANGKVSAWQAAAWPAGGSCAIVLKDANDKATTERVIKIFSALAKRSNSPLNRVVLPAELQRLGAIPEAALMLEAATGYAFDEALTGAEVRATDSDYRGTHGYLPSRAEMRSALMIYGASAQVGAKLRLAKMIDIAPTAAAVLGLWFDHAEGAIIRELIKPGSLPKIPKPNPKKAARP